MSKPMSRPFEPEGQKINLISSGTKIIGNVAADGDIRIDGELKGNIQAKGRLVVGASGRIEGEISCNNIEVSGEVKGKILADDLLSMKATAKISGEIMAGKLAVEPGSLFTGTCMMGGKTNDPSRPKQQ
jgi:cytoskeletal protein CcmA (bactofilin family)